MTTQQQAYALSLSDELLKGMWVPNVLQNESALRARAAQELRRLHAENERLRTCNKDAQHEIANLQERVQELGQMARDVNSRRVQELEAQLAAVGVGGVEPLRKRECLHQISEPAQAQPVDLEPVAAQSRFLTEKGWGTCTLEHHLYVKANPVEWPGYETRALYAAPQLAAPAQAAPASIITASVMRDDGGEHPAFCLMVAYRTEKAAMAALAMLTGAPAQAATAKQSPHPEYDKGFSDGWNRCEERQAAAPAGMEPVARIEGIDEYGPRLEWTQHWVDVGVGAKLYTASQVQAMRHGSDAALKSRLLTALERASLAECALRALIDECESDSIPGWEDRMNARINAGNAMLAAAPSGPAREPLSQERLQFLSGEYEDIPEEGVAFRDGWRSAEMHHGITAAQKGGQHG